MVFIGFLIVFDETIEKNPPAPKVLRRGSLVARDMNSQLVQLQLGVPTSSRCTVSSPLGRTLNKVEAKGSQVAPCWTWHGLSCASLHGFNLGSIWSIWAQLQPNITNWFQLGPSWAQDSVASVAARVQAGPILPTQCDTLKTWIFAAISVSNVFWLCGGFVRGPVPHIGPVLGPTSAPDAPAQDQAAHVPTCA